MLSAPVACVLARLLFWLQQPAFMMLLNMCELNRRAARVHRDWVVFARLQCVRILVLVYPPPLHGCVVVMPRHVPGAACFSASPGQFV